MRRYYALILFATRGWGFLPARTNWSPRSSAWKSAHFHVRARRLSPPGFLKASLKCFLLGSFATAFFLYGIAMVFSATGTSVTACRRRSRACATQGNRCPRAVLGLAHFAGLGFKVVVAHSRYSPDVYERAPTP